MAPGKVSISNIRFYLQEMAFLVGNHNGAAVVKAVGNHFGSRRSNPHPLVIKGAGVPDQVDEFF